jgi:hypothetical protein
MFSTALTQTLKIFKNGQVKINLSDFLKYQNNFVNCLPRHIIQNVDLGKSTYEGFLKNGIPEGIGKLSLSSGMIFEGTWKNGLPLGHGKKYGKDYFLKGYFTGFDVVNGEM